MAGEVRGRDALMAWLGKLRSIGFWLTEQDVFGNDDHVCALSVMGARRDGVDVQTRVVSVFRYRDGQQVERWIHPEDRVVWEEMFSCLRPAIEIDWHTTEREGLRPLFELAEEPEVLDSYLELGRVLVALEGGVAVGHLQLVRRGPAGDARGEEHGRRRDPSPAGASGGRWWSARSPSAGPRARQRCSSRPRRPTPATCASTSGSASACCACSATRSPRRRATGTAS